jgi:hypothetical protein
MRSASAQLRIARSSARRATSALIWATSIPP